MKKPRVLLFGLRLLLAGVTAVVVYRARTPEACYMVNFKDLDWYAERARVACHANEASAPTTQLLFVSPRLTTRTLVLPAHSRNSSLK